MTKALAQIATLLLACVATVQGGTSAVSENYASSQSWYRSGEFDVQLSGAYASSANTYHYVDKYLRADHAWGGGLDLKYFPNRYLGVGLSGEIVSARQSFPYYSYFAGQGHYFTEHNRSMIGAGLATVTFRYPIAGSRIAPYVYAGGGAIAGGGELLRFQYLGYLGKPPGTNPSRAYTTDGETAAVGNFGGGVEFRVTPNVGLTSEFSWNVVDGRDNNFGTFRSGVSLAF